MQPFRHEKKLPLKLSRPAAAPTAKSGFVCKSRLFSEREAPSAFGKLGTKAPLGVAAARLMRRGQLGRAWVRRSLHLVHSP